MEREPESPEPEDRDLTIDPGEAVKEAREAERESGRERESTTERDQIRETGFGG